MSLKSRLLWSLVRLAVLNHIMSIWEGPSVRPIVPGEGEPGEEQNPVLCTVLEHPPREGTWHSCDLGLNHLLSLLWRSGIRISCSGLLSFGVSEVCIISVLVWWVISVSSDETEKAQFLPFRNGVYSNQIALGIDAIALFLALLHPIWC